MAAFIFKTYFLPPAEYGKIISEIDECYEKYKDKRFAVHMSYDIEGNPFWYYFENHGMGEYNIYDKKDVREEDGKNE